jgi:hypothetical protein
VEVGWGAYWVGSLSSAAPLHPLLSPPLFPSLLSSCPPPLLVPSPLHGTDRAVVCCCCMGQQRVVGWENGRWRGRDVAVLATRGRPSSRPVVGLVVVVVEGGGRR